MSTQIPHPSEIGIGEHFPAEILPIPKFPAALIDASARGSLVPFIGAGASRLAGCPSWSEFADNAIEYLVASQILSPMQKSQLGNLAPRLKLSVAKIQSQQQNVSIDFRSILQTGNWSTHSDGNQLYGLIGSLARRFVTTNYDEWLDIPAPPPTFQSQRPETSDQQPAISTRTSLHTAEQITAERFGDSECVVHLHGSIVDPENMVVSTGDYIKRYAADRHRESGGSENTVLSFLEYLFSEKNVLFIGYGLDELEILEYIIMKSRTGRRPVGRELRHCIIQGFFSFELELCHSLESYFRDECGIQLIPFSRDANDWHQLINVITDLAKRLPPNLDLLAEDFRIMEGLVNG